VLGGQLLAADDRPLDEARHLRGDLVGSARSPFAVGVPPDRSDRSRFSLCRKLDVTYRTLRLP
jgi:hypothetical protein